MHKRSRSATIDVWSAECWDGSALCGSSSLAQGSSPSSESWVGCCLGTGVSDPWSDVRTHTHTPSFAEEAAAAAAERDTLELLDRLVSMEGVIDDRQETTDDPKSRAVLTNSRPDMVSVPISGVDIQPVLAIATPPQQSFPASAVDHPQMRDSPSQQQYHPPLGTAFVSLPYPAPVAAAIPLQQPPWQAYPSPPPVKIADSSKPMHGLGGGSGRNSAERLQWSVDEDRMIVEFVREHGCRWRLIASMLEGRSDDAVRNVYLALSPSPSTPSCDSLCALTYRLMFRVPAMQRDGTVSKICPSISM